MTPNNNLSVLPWYDSIERQNHRRDYAFGNIYPLITPVQKLLPFQMRRDTRTNEITQVILYDLTGNKIADITTAMKETGLIINRYEDDGYDLIIYPGNLLMAIKMPEGMYYVTMSDGVQTWYSEVFNAVNKLDDFLKIEWWDEEPLYYSGGHIEYGNGFKNRVYLNTQLCRPDYNFEEDGEDRDGFFFAEKQLSEKVYKFNFLAPEYLCDAMRIIRMSDYVEITNKGEKYNAEKFLITPKWQDQGDLAAVDAEFETDTVIKKIGQGYIKEVHGDFNNDYNADYNNE